MTSNIQINHERLKELLNARRLNQEELAAKIKADIGTVSRWARGETTKLRRSNFNKLRDALNATEADLCGEGPLPDGKEKREASPEGQVSFVVDTACRNALALVARRYGVRQRQIVEIAPLLFSLIAEQSLAERRQELEVFKAAVDDAENEAPPHMKRELRFAHDEDDRALIEREEQSIAARDLFARQVGYEEDDPAAGNPLALHLDRLLASSSAPHGVYKGKNRVLWEQGEEPRYSVGIEELNEILGGDKEAMRHVLRGRVALAEMPGEVRKATPEQKAEWVKADLQRSVEDLANLSSSLDELSVDEFRAAAAADPEEEF